MSDLIDKDTRAQGMRMTLACKRARGQSYSWAKGFKDEGKEKKKEKDKKK